MSAVIVGIDGGSCSGKTTISKKLAEKFDAALVYKDNYYLSRHGVSKEEKENINYDHPNAFEWDLLTEHLRLLKSGTSVQGPQYDFALHDRKDIRCTIEPKDIIIVEGIMLFWSEALRELCDIKIFVDSSNLICLKRRIERDVKERGRTRRSVIKQFLRDVLPMHKLYVEPYKSAADIVISSDEIEKASKAVESFLEGAKK